MPVLTVFADDRPDAPLAVHTDLAGIAAVLTGTGVACATWPLLPGIAPGVPAATVLAIYAERIAAVSAQGGYASADAVSIAPDDPERAAKRAKFLSEHTHAEDEVRFFAAGSGLFSLHFGGRVHQLRCSAGDLIAIPAGTPHWFDMGPEPAFVAVRWFTNPAGWVGAPTGWSNAERFPRLG